MATPYTGWSTQDNIHKHPNIILAQETYQASNNVISGSFIFGVRSAVPFDELDPKSPSVYYEIEILGSKTVVTEFFVGLATAAYPLATPINTFTGTIENTLIRQDGRLNRSDSPFITGGLDGGDTLSFKLNFDTNQVLVWKNGNFIGPMPFGLQLEPEWYPMVAVNDSDIQFQLRDGAFDYGDDMAGFKEINELESFDTEFQFFEFDTNPATSFATQTNDFLTTPYFLIASDGSLSSNQFTQAQQDPEFGTYPPTFKFPVFQTEESESIEWDQVESGSGFTFTGSTTASGVVDTTAITNTGRSSGSRYWEIEIVSGGPGFIVGFGVENYDTGLTLGNPSSELAIGLADNGDILQDGTSQSSGGSYAVGDVVQVAIDLDRGLVWFGVNGVYVQGNPSNRTNPLLTIPRGTTIFPMVSQSGASSYTITGRFSEPSQQFLLPSLFTAMDLTVGSSVGDRPEVSFDATSASGKSVVSAVGWSTNDKDLKVFLKAIDDI